jgi:hypothetical protein
MGSRGLTAALAALVVAWLVWAVAANAAMEHAAADGVSATLTYTHNQKNVVSPYQDLRLTITRDGHELYDEAVKNAACGNLCYPDRLHVLDVEADGEPDVLLDLYTGGAHCCFVTEVFRYDDAASHHYTSLLQVWGDPGYKLEQLDGSRPYEFVSADDRFAYEFTAYAFSGLPLLIERLENGHFVDVTRSYPALIAPDAARWWKDYLENRSGKTGLGFLAAWAADEYNLGKEASVTSTLAGLEKANELRSDLSVWPSGAKFVTSLERFLLKTGYAG